MTKAKKIIAISGSLRAESFSSNVVRILEKYVPADSSYAITNKLDKLPYFNPDIDEPGRFQELDEFRAEISEADAVIICTPEYAHAVPGVLRNALDWIASSGEFLGKRTGLLSVSPLTTGGQEALHSLSLTLGIINADIPSGATLAIPTITKKITSNGDIIDPTFSTTLQQFIENVLKD